MTKFTFGQYETDYSLKTVFNKSEEIIFLKYKVVDSLEEISLDSNYIYNIENDKYHIYIGITSNKENANKLKEFYKKKEYNLDEVKISVSNKEFLELLKQYDNLLLSITDEQVIESINKVIIEKYKELVINDNEN